MPNVLDANGLQTATRDELIAYFTAQYQSIYGADVNLAADTPDGQWMGIQVQVVLDLQDLLRQIYNTFDPDNAVGVVLDQRVAINGIQRQEGTFTLTDITMVLAQSVNLRGLDTVEETDPALYIVSDNAGNRWFLETTQIGVGPGTFSFSFRAEFPGQVLSIPNTITTPVTVVLGVTSVNNPTLYTVLGTNEESDAQLKVRRQQSVSLASQGYLAGLLAALENITGVTSAFVYENNTDGTDSDGVPSHTIWVIVAGTGAAADIAQAIYTKRNAGAGMFGDETYTITQIDGSPFIVRWDEVLTRSLYIAFTATSINGTTPPNVEAIRDGLPELFIPGVFEQVDINELATKVQEIDANCLVTNAGFSDGTEQTLNMDNPPGGGSFEIKYDGNVSAAINWNDPIGTIQTKVQAVPGLAAALVTGSLAGQQLVFDLSNIGNVESLLIVPTATNTTGANFTNDPNYTPTLAPLSKQFQFVVVPEDIIITPIILLPETAVVAAAATETFTAFGGYGDYTYTISVNNSGGTIGASSGLYTAGPTTGVDDTILVTDEFGNTATATVSVV